MGKRRCGKFTTVGILQLLKTSFAFSCFKGRGGERIKKCTVVNLCPKLKYGQMLNITFKNMIPLNFHSFQLKHEEYPNELERATALFLPSKLNIRDHNFMSVILV